VSRDAVYIGIDPGAHGGLAWIRRRGSMLSYSAVSMPSDRSVIWGWFVSCLGSASLTPVVPTYACIEKVGGYIGNKGRDDTDNPAPGSAMFNFGMSYGMLLAFLTVADIPHAEVHSTTWQTAFGLRGKGSGKLHGRTRRHKDFLKGKAQCLFPNLRVTLYNADALLLAEYCRMRHEGEI
jgi:hypothetical protein